MSFSKQEIDFNVPNSIPAIVSNYLERNEFLKPFYDRFPDKNGFQKIIENRRMSSSHRKVLVEVLKEQNKRSEDLVINNIDSLLNENTFTVTTGHQLNLFTGPLYFIYKILSTIKLAQWLKISFPKNDFVPVYWMASEDHDIAEINHTSVFGKKILWDTKATGAAGKINCDGIQDLIPELKSVLGESENADKIIGLLTSAYAKEHSLSDATRILVAGLFSKYGLVILDADDVRLKKLFSPSLEEEILNQSSFVKVNESNSFLEQAGYGVQVHPREINLFYISENSRERIVTDDGIYKVVNTEKKWSRQEVLEELKNHPENFSPNVVLRPLYQETILPNIGYIGGPSEIAYWLEFKAMFDHFKVSFPALVLRNSAMIVDKVSAERLEKLHIPAEDIFRSYDELAKDFVMRNQDSVSIKDEVSKMTLIYDSLIQKAAATDVTIAKSVEAEKQKQLNSLKVLEEKIIRAEKKKHEVSLQQIQKLKDRFFPGGTMQERDENFISYYLKYGDSFFDKLLELFNPIPSQFLLIRE